MLYFFTFLQRKVEKGNLSCEKSIEPYKLTTYNRLKDKREIISNAIMKAQTI